MFFTSPTERQHRAEIHWKPGRAKASLGAAMPATPNPKPITRLTANAARRIALAAQGFGDKRPIATVNAGHARRVLDRIHLLQIDSVNVIARSHTLPFFSRLGAYPHGLLERLAYGRKRQLFEYWAHEASFIPLEHHPFLRWRMERAERGQGIYKELARFGRERRDFIERVYREIAEAGPISAGELSGGGKASGGWWGWSEGKTALEFLFWAGRITTATRRNFTRVYDLSERVWPEDIRALPTPSVEAAQRGLLMLAARAMGVASEADLRDYFRLEAAESKARLAELVEEGALLPVEVVGWRQLAYLHPEARRPRRITARALLSPFDSLVWNRDRSERLFGFRYRLEIYTPEAKRLHGYYVLPFLLGERLVGRVDLKADRAAGLLRVQAAHAEGGVQTDEVGEALAAELRLLAGWLGLDSVTVAQRGDLSEVLANATARGK